MKSLEVKVSVTYEFFIQEISNKFDFDFKPNRNEKALIKNFCAYLEEQFSSKETIGVDWLFNYFSFQFNYWLDKITRRGSSGIADLSWIIGDKAYARWEERTPQFKYFVDKGLLLFYKGIKKSKLEFLLQETPKRLHKDLLEIDIAEEIEKKRFYGQKRGLLHCSSTTTLYHHRSPLCSNCSFRNECFILLESNYKVIFEKRKYNQKEKQLINV